MSTAYAVTVQLSENQKRQLGVEMQKSIQDGHYGAAYTYYWTEETQLPGYTVKAA